MILYVFDHQGGGLHYGTALIACGLVAGTETLDWIARARVYLALRSEK